jgi:phage/plasmid-associated DNA primase
MLTTPITDFKAFKKDFANITSDGYSSVFQTPPTHSVIYSVMRFEFDEAIGRNVINADAIGKFVYAHQEVVSQTLPQSNVNDRTCVVMTHPQVETDDLYYEEVYFFFPYLKCNIDHMVERINSNLRYFFNNTGFFDQLELQPINEIEDILNPEFYRRPWPLAGSYMEGNIITIDQVYESITKENVDEGVIVGFPAEAYFSQFQIPDGSEYDISTSFFFSNLNGFDVVPRKKTQREKNRDHTSRMIDMRQREEKRTPEEMCSILMSMLNPDRFAREHDREKIGQVLFNVTLGSDSGLDLWKEFNSRKLEAFNNSYPDMDSASMSMGMSVEQFQTAINNEDPRVCSTQLRIPEEDLEVTIENVNDASEELWQFMDYDKVTINTLRYWAHMDSPPQYKAFLQKDVTTLAWKCLNSTSSHTDVARLTYTKYCDSIVCANIKDGVWFGYWQNRWHEMDRCHYLRIRISSEMPPIFEKILDECHLEYKKAVSDREKERWSEYMKAAQKMIKDLKTVQYKNNLVQECAEHFFDRDFISKLDENRQIIGCPNGVYDLINDVFRQGKPEDFITLSTGAKFNTNFHRDHPKIKEVEYYFSTVYPDPELNNYAKKAFASILEGGNMNKDFYNMIGVGDNSKSMVAKALKQCFGNYISKIPVALLMGKRGNADGATPHLADKKGVRALFAEEAPRGKSNVSVIKEMSGNDDICARALFKMPVTFSPQWKLFMWSNHMLLAEAEEKAYWNRQKVVEHESVFTFDCPKTEAEQFAQKRFPRDPLFDAKVIAMADALLWCLTDWYKKYKEEGLIPPERVLQATNLAKMKNDVYLQYMKASLVQGVQHNTITVSEMYEDFRGWHQKMYQNNHTIPDRMHFEEEMSKVGYLGVEPDAENKWIGICLKNTAIQLNNMAGLVAQANMPQLHNTAIAAN